MEDEAVEQIEAGAMAVEPKIEHIIKSENDNKSYRGLTVNQIKVLLISDPTTEKSAVALDVNIGSILDPDNMSGLAQLLQQMLYLTKMNVNQQYFRNSVENNNGKIEGEVNEDHSTYYFDISPTERFQFKNALKTFAAFFPVFPNIVDIDVLKDAINGMREVRNLTRNPNGTNNIEALTQLFKWTINCDHLMSKRGYDVTHATNEDYLTIIDQLVMFYESYYYAHNMSLCVYSKDSLNELQEWVIESFSNIRSKDAAIVPHMKLYHWHPVDFTSAYKIWCAPYNQNSPYTRLYIIFPTEEFKNCRYTIALEHFFAYLFKYNGKESFLSVLKTKGWGCSMEVKNLFASICCIIFNIGIDLTDEGLKHIDDIMTLFIQYVKMLKEYDDNKLRKIYNEYQEINELQFHRPVFEEKTSIENVKIISKELHYTMNIKDILRLKHVPIVNSERIIKDVINNFLTSQCLRIYIIAKEYNNCTEELEPWCSYKYKKEEISTRTLSNWMNNQCAKLSLPAYNQFIPTKFNIKPDEDNVEEKNPTIIWNTEFVRLWYKKDDEFNEPKAIMHFHFISPTAYENSFNANLMNLFIRLINNSLSEYLYPAALVDLKCKIFATIYGMQLDIFGYDDKQYILLEKIVNRILNFQLSPENFEIHRKNHIQSCAKQLTLFANEPTCNQANYYLSMLLNNYLLARDEILTLREEITFKRVQQFKSDLFSSMYVECLIYGNKTRAEALEIAHLIDNKLSDGIPLKMPFHEMHRDFKCELRHNIKFNKIRDGYLILTEEKKFLESFVQLFYEIGKRTIQSDVLLHLITQIIYEPLNKLRGEEMWSDVLDTDVYTSNQIQGLKILIIHLRLADDEIIEQIENCMNNFIKEFISQMSEEEFQQNKQLLADSYNENKPKTLYNASTAFWAEILNQEYKFNRIDDQLNELEKTTKNDLCTFFEGLLNSTKKTILGHFL